MQNGQEIGEKITNFVKNYQIVAMHLNVTRL
jgi:hypothetical protein